MVGQAKRFAQEILDGTKHATRANAQAALECFRGEIEQMVPRVRQVIAQTRARIFHGETRTEGKICSLFEPSTEIIRKGKAGKPTEFGKLVKLQEAENQLVIDYEVYDQRPNDTTLLIPAIGTHEAVLGRTPPLVAAQARAEEALVPQRPEVANGVRGAHQRGQAPAWSQPLPLQGRCRHEALGRPRCYC